MATSVSICKICKEPLWSFICMDCVSTDLKRWLPAKLAPHFEQFTSDFYRFFATGSDMTFDRCLHCKAEKESPVCTFCYMNEALSWLKSSSSGTQAAQAFAFRFEMASFAGPFINTRLQPVSMLWCDARHEGDCDGCGEYSEALRERGKQLLCEECIGDDE